MSIAGKTFIYPWTKTTTDCGVHVTSAIWPEAVPSRVPLTDSGSLGQDFASEPSE